MTTVTIVRPFIIAKCLLQANLGDIVFHDTLIVSF